MSFNKISGLQPLLAAVPFSLGASESMILPAGQGIIGAFGSVTTPQIASGNPLSGQYIIGMGQYTTLQAYDQGLYTWRNMQVNPQSLATVSSDGQNYRLANNTGCVIGALITNAGSGYTNGFYGYNQQGAAITIQNGAVTPGNTTLTVTPSAGGSLWNAIVGGAVNTTIGITGTLYENQPFGGTGTSVTGSGGSAYTRAPLLVFSPPPNQGAQPYILPTAVCTISAGAINSVTVINQGAGLQGLPNITVVPQLGDTTGAGAVLGWTSGNSAMVGTGTILALYPAAHGTAAVTAVPTLTFSPASTTAATAIMNFTITSFTAGTAGVAYVAAGAAFNGGIVAGTAANTNPILDKALSIPIFPPVNVAATTGLPSLSGPFGGVNIQAVPTITSFSSGAAPSTAAATTVNVGGASDTLFLYSI
jgi:hypothetical protein